MVKKLRFFLRTALAGMAVAGMVQAASPSLPNVVIILADDLGYGDVHCYNPESKVPTPNLDRLAAQGMRFTDAHSPATVCTPSRYSLLTGQMAFRVPRGGTVFTGAGGPSLIAPERLTLAEMLKEKGYATAAVGKWHVGLTFYDHEGRPIHQGGLAGSNASIIPDVSMGVRSTTVLTISSAPPVARPQTGCMPSSKGIVFRFGLPISWIAVDCPKTRIPVTVGQA